MSFKNKLELLNFDTLTGNLPQRCINTFPSRLIVILKSSYPVKQHFHRPGAFGNILKLQLLLLLMLRRMLDRLNCPNRPCCQNSPLLPRLLLPLLLPETKQVENFISSILIYVNS